MCKNSNLKYESLPGKELYHTEQAKLHNEHASLNTQHM